MTQCSACGGFCGRVCQRDNTNKAPQPAAPSTSPLTDEQIEAIYEGLKGKGWSKDFARAIEAAHGIGAKP